MTSLLSGLTRRERHIMDVLFRLGRASAEEVMRELSGDPSYSTVRTQLRVLEEKGHVRHEEARAQVHLHAHRGARGRAQTALRHVVDTFFEGSVEKVVAALLGSDGGRLSPDELRRIADLVSKAKKEGVR